MKNTIVRPEHKYKYIHAETFAEYKYDFFLAWNVLAHTIGIYSYPIFRQIQMQVYSGLPKMGEHEYEYN